MAKDKLTGKQLKAIELMISTPMTQIQIAEAVGVSDETIYRWSRKDVFRAKMEEENRKRYKDSAIKARQEVESLAFKSKNDYVRLNACKDILDRAGYKPKEEVDLGGIDIKIDYGG